MTDWPLLSLTIFLPLLGAGAIMTIRGEAELVARNARYVALWTSLITFVLSLMVWDGFEPKLGGFQFVEKAPWITTFNISYYLGVDGISVFFVLLATFLTPLCILASWDTIRDRVK
ncbi:MAG: NADH-quinone oxidoreductase subunit M, partial [Alphaproteobacteria bacterium]